MRSIAICFVLSVSALAQPPGENDVLVRVVDVGAGLCCASTGMHS